MTDPASGAPGPPQFLIHRPGDSIAVAVADLQAGRVHGAVLATGERLERELLRQVPLGHKFALADIAAGDEVIEYGVRIGVAVAAIPVGDYVHVHNLRSARWPSRSAD
jgi:(2R)-sulfolactate sulfo-lyase subunit alpha